MTQVSLGLEDCSGTGFRLPGVDGEASLRGRGLITTGQVEEREGPLGAREQQGPLGGGGRVRSGGGRVDWASMRAVNGHSWLSGIF